MQQGTHAGAAGKADRASECRIERGGGWEGGWIVPSMAMLPPTDPLTACINASAENSLEASDCPPACGVDAKSSIFSPRDRCMEMALSSVSASPCTDVIATSFPHTLPPQHWNPRPLYAQGRPQKTARKRSHAGRMPQQYPDLAGRRWRRDPCHFPVAALLLAPPGPDVSNFHLQIRNSDVE